MWIDYVVEDIIKVACVVNTRCCEGLDLEFYKYTEDFYKMMDSSQEQMNAKFHE